MTADTLQRAHLEGRRAYFIARIDAFGDYALALWRRANALRAAGKDSHQLDHLALDAEERCYRFSRALIAIENELDEGEDD